MVSPRGKKPAAPKPPKQPEAAQNPRELDAEGTALIATARQMIDSVLGESRETVRATKLIDVGADEAMSHGMVDSAMSHRTNLKIQIDEVMKALHSRSQKTAILGDLAVLNVMSHADDLRYEHMRGVRNANTADNQLAQDSRRYVDFALNQQYNLEPSQGAAERVVLGSASIDAVAIGKAVAEILNPQMTAILTSLKGLLEVAQEG